MGLTWKERLELIKLLRIDIYMMLFFISFSISGVSLNQLVEDKVCLNQLKLDKSICMNLEHTDNSHETNKNYIFSKAAAFKNYQTLIFTTPGIFLSLFIGYWIDNYPSHLKFILAAPAFGGTLGAFIIIYNCFYFETDYMQLLSSDVLKGFAGGFATIYTGVYTYITRKTPAKFRALRFAILEFFSFIATPISIYLGGFLLTTPPWFDKQPRNYIAVFIVSAVCSTLSLIWVLVFVNDADSRQETKNDTTNDSNSLIDDQESRDTVDDGFDAPDSMIKQPVSKGCFGNFTHTFADIFNFANVKSMFNTCTKKRENGFRVRIWHSLIISAVILLAYMGDVAIGFPFAQKVYHWDARYYSNISSILIIIPSIGTSLLSPILIRKFGFSDTGLGILGCLSLLSSMIIRGGWLTPVGYFVASVCGIFGGLTPISIRSLIARMINFDEIGQVYSLLSAIESCAPAISSLFYSNVFNATIGSFPGLVYQIAAGLLFYPFFILIWLDLTKSTWYDTKKVDSVSINHPEDGVDTEVSKSSHARVSINSDIQADAAQLIS